MITRLFKLGVVLGLLISPSFVGAFNWDCSPYELRGGVDVLYWQSCSQGFPYARYNLNRANFVTTDVIREHSPA